MNSPEVPPDVIVDAMTLADEPLVAALWGEHFEGFDRAFDSAERIAAYLERNPGLSSVARSDGRIVGVLLCGTDGRRGSLYHLIVHPAFRSHGIARRLVERCLDQLKSRGIFTAFCFTHRENDAGRAFWKSAGFNAVEVIEYRSRAFGP